MADEVGYTFYVDTGPRPGERGLLGSGDQVRTRPTALTVNMDAQSNVESLSFSFDGFEKTLWFLYIHIPALAGIRYPCRMSRPLNPPLGRKPPLYLQSRFMNRGKRADKDSAAKYNPLEAAARAGASFPDLRPDQRLGQSGCCTTAASCGPAAWWPSAGPASHDGHYFVKSVTPSAPGEYKAEFHAHAQRTCLLLQRFLYERH